MNLYAEYAAFTHLVITAMERLYEMREFLGLHIGKEAEMAGIDTHDGYAQLPYLARDAQEGSVTPKAEYHLHTLIYIEDHLIVKGGEQIQ